ncbi:MAG: HNH endonuclease [Cyclobacteriaceae bacterium]
MPQKGYRKPGAKARSVYQRKYNSKPEQLKNRAKRNKARRLKKCPAGKDVHHKDGNPRNNSKSNLSCTSVKSNRSRNKHKKRK